MILIFPSLWLLVLRSDFVPQSDFTTFRVAQVSFQGGSGETVSIRRQGLCVTFADALRDHVAQVQWMDSMSC